MKPQPFIPHWPFTKANPKHCNETVYDRWRIDVVGHQCPYKKSVEIDGIGFCKVHAKRYQPWTGGQYE